MEDEARLSELIQRANENQKECNQKFEAIMKTMHELKVIIADVASRLPAPSTPEHNVETSNTPNSDGQATLEPDPPDLSRCGGLMEDNHLSADVRQKFDDEVIRGEELVEMEAIDESNVEKDAADSDARQLFDEMPQSANINKIEHIHDLLKGDGEQNIANKVLVQNLTLGMLKSDDIVTHSEEMTHTKLTGESNVAKDPTDLVDHQVFDEMFKPQRPLKPVVLIMAIEVIGLFNARKDFIVLWNENFEYAQDSTELFVHPMEVSFDPGGMTFAYVPYITPLLPRSMFLLMESFYDKFVGLHCHTNGDVGFVLAFEMVSLIKPEIVGVVLDSFWLGRIMIFQLQVNETSDIIGGLCFDPGGELFREFIESRQQDFQIDSMLLLKCDTTALFGASPSGIDVRQPRVTTSEFGFKAIHVGSIEEEDDLEDNKLSEFADYVVFLMHSIIKGSTPLLLINELMGLSKVQNAFPAQEGIPADYKGSEGLLCLNFVAVKLVCAQSVSYLLVDMYVDLCYYVEALTDACDCLHDKYWIKIFEGTMKNLQQQILICNEIRSERGLSNVLEIRDVNSKMAFKTIYDSLQILVQGVVKCEWFKLLQFKRGMISRLLKEIILALDQHAIKCALTFLSSNLVKKNALGNGYSRIEMLNSSLGMTFDPGGVFIETVDTFFKAYENGGDTYGVGTSLSRLSDMLRYLW